MTNNLHNIVVHIKDEAMLQEAITKVKKYGFEVSNGFFNIKGMDYFGLTNGKFFFGFKSGRTEITLTELEQKLKQNRDAESK